MTRRIIFFLAILIFIFGWFTGDSIAISNSGLEEMLNIFASVSQDKREVGAIVLNEYLKDMENGVENLKGDMDSFLNEEQKQRLENMGYSLDSIKSEMDILKKWNLEERKSLITYVKSGDKNGIKNLVSSAGKTTPSIPDGSGSIIQPVNPGKTDNAGNIIQPPKDNTSIKKDEVKEKDEKLLEVLFKDIEEHINKDAIVYLAERGIIKGKTSEKFDPNGELTRAEFVMLIQNVLDIKPIEEKEFNFKDVEKDKWYYSAVKSTFDHKIVNGTSPTSFSPDKQVTREAMVSIIMRILNDKGITFTLEKTDRDISIYSDSETISDWAMQDMFYAVKYDLIQSRTDSFLKPTSFATRGEAAEIIKKLYNLTKSGEKN